MARRLEVKGAMQSVMDAVTGTCHDAPSNAIYLFNEMKAACATITERWPAIKPPKSAIL